MLVIALLLGMLPLSGCGIKAGASFNICEQFLSYINAGEYEEAYGLLHSNVRYSDAQWEADEADEEKSPPSKRITPTQFVSRYTNIFEELQIEGLDYTMLSEVTGNVVCVYDYMLTYRSSLYEPETMNFRMSVLIEDGEWRIEWAPDLVFPDMEWGDTVRVASIPAVRGEILADGMAYAQNVNAVSICAVPSSIEDATLFSRQVSLLTDIPADTILKRLDTTNELVILKQLYPDDLSEELEEELLRIDGVAVDKRNFGTLRNYPQGSTLAHIIGYTGPATAEDLEAFAGSAEGNEYYNTDSYVGKSGLERAYETQLRGTDGYYVYICTSSGENRKTLYRHAAEDGLDIQLTVDPDLQEKTELLLKYSLYGEDTAGAVVVLDPTTGEIKAMSSYPTFDLNMFARGISATQMQEITNAGVYTPLLNRLTQGRYAPGSIFKPFTAAAALSSGAMTTETEFPTSRERIEDNKWRPSDDGEFGPWRYAIITRVEFKNRRDPLNMHNGMIYSDNIYFAYSALKMGEDAFRSYIEPLGFTEGMPFDLPVASAQLANAGSEWDPMLLATSAYGQGEVLVTPLQAAVQFSAFANEGTMMQPYIVEGLYRVEGVKYEQESHATPTVWKQSAISKSIVDTLLPMLEDVSVTGTGQHLGLKRVMRVAAKTGTAEVGTNREIAWYVGFRMESEEPRLVLVMLELPANTEIFNYTKFDIARELLKE